jgi:hypothetical protein
VKHLRYFRYIVRHKWFVFLAGCELGIPFLAAMHDNSKFRPSEWRPYANFFYGPKAVQRRDSTGYYKPTDTGDAVFDFAWLLHQKRNKHHWQWWVLPEDNGGVKVLPMADKYRREMLADWWGAGRAQGKRAPKDDPWRETRAWYMANSQKMRLHLETKLWIEQQIFGAMKARETA